MQISSTRLQASKKLNSRFNQAQSDNQETVPQDTVTLSSGRYSLAEKIKIGAVGLVGAGVGAVPWLGAASGAFCSFASGEMGNNPASLTAAASAVANVVTCLAVGGGASPYLFAVPAVLGGLSWAGAVGGQKARGH